MSPAAGGCGEHAHAAGEDRLAEPGRQRQRPARIDLAIGKDHEIGSRDLRAELGLGQEAQVEGEPVAGPRPGDLGLQRLHRHERLAGDDDGEVLAAAGQLDAGAHQQVDPLVGLEGAEQQDPDPTWARAVRRGGKGGRRGRAAGGPAR